MEKKLLNEHVKTLFTDDQRRKVVDDVWDILQLSYSTVPGGFATADTKEELLQKSGLWKLVYRGGNITAVKLYKNKLGRKAIASGTDGTRQGKSDLRMLMKEDLRMKKMWAEVSGAPEKILSNMGYPKIEAKYAAMLTGKPILSIDEDGYHYVRFIRGTKHQKIMFGFINPSEEELNEFAKMGVDVKDLPKE